MQFEEMFEKYVEWKILRLFLRNPTTPFYVKEVARKLKVSSSSVSNFLNRMQKDNIFKKEIAGNTHLYRLNNELGIVKKLKVFHTLVEIQDVNLVKLFKEKDETIISIVLYGSHASGENDEKSDFDLLMISNQKKDFIDVLQEIEKKLGKEVTVERFSIADWNEVKRKDETFYKSILENHIILYGSGLP